MLLQVCRNNFITEATNGQQAVEETAPQKIHPLTETKTEEILKRLRNHSALSYGYAMAMTAWLDDTGGKAGL